MHGMPQAHGTPQCMGLGGNAGGCCTQHAKQLCRGLGAGKCRGNAATNTQGSLPHKALHRTAGGWEKGWGRGGKGKDVERPTRAPTQGHTWGCAVVLRAPPPPPPPPQSCWGPTQAKHAQGGTHGVCMVHGRGGAAAPPPPSPAPSCPARACGLVHLSYVRVRGGGFVEQKGGGSQGGREAACVSPTGETGLHVHRCGVRNLPAGKKRGGRARTGHDGTRTKPLWNVECGWRA